jgi:hypothetical protein
MLLAVLLCRLPLKVLDGSDGPLGSFLGFLGGVFCYLSCSSGLLGGLLSFLDGVNSSGRYRFWLGR